LWRWALFFTAPFSHALTKETVKLLTRLPIYKGGISAKPYKRSA